MTFESTIIGGKDIRLRYRAASIMTIEKDAGKKIGPAGLKFIAQRAGIEFSPNDKIPIELVMAWMDMDFDTMLWIWGFGLDWKESGAKRSDAPALYDEYMADAEADDGERFKAFKSMAVDAINAARGIDTKKLIETNKIRQEEAIEEAERTRIRAESIRRKVKKEMAGTGKEQPDSASES